MKLLDTNVLSELMRETPHPHVLAYLNQAQEPFFTTYINVAEINNGLAALPDGKKRTRLQCRFGQFCTNVFTDKILSFDEQAASHAGSLFQKRMTAGKHIDAVDHLIASIAFAHSATLVTRNMNDFTDYGIDLINPWNE